VAEPIADIERARDAVGREAWADAYESFQGLDHLALSPQDLEGLANSAWWLSKIDESIAARQRAYTSYAEAGEELRAAGCALRLCIEHFYREEPAVGAGWLGRARRHLNQQPECVEQGFLAVIQATVMRFGGQLDAALALAARGLAIGQRFGERNLLAMAIHTEGLIHISAGKVSEGLPLLDEAMTSVVAGELSDYFTGAIYCNVIEACLLLADVRRAAEWSEAARAWCDTIPPESPFHGVCRVNRAEVARLRGEWPEAEAEATRAVDELSRLDPSAAARAFYEIGEIRRRTGAYAGAEEAFARAHSLGLEPQPGLALLRLSQGKVEAARTALGLTESGDASTAPQRARLLAAKVEVALAAIDLDEARAARDELKTIARVLETPALAASAAIADGAVRLAEADLPAALGILRRGCATWQELKLPYETAKARVLCGLALRAAGDEEDAELELRAALTTFERLGAAPDVATTAALLPGDKSLPRGLTPREAEVLRLVAAGKTNRDIAVELVISEHTVARHLQNMFVKLDVSSRSGATAFAFEHGLA
jgi:ATP/maltotriose-dependent transcriptional regulator MalT